MLDGGVGLLTATTSVEETWRLILVVLISMVHATCSPAVCVCHHIDEVELHIEVFIICTLHSLFHDDKVRTGNGVCTAHERTKNPIQIIPAHAQI